VLHHLVPLCDTSLQALVYQYLCSHLFKVLTLHLLFLLHCHNCLTETGGAASSAIGGRCHVLCHAPKKDYLRRLLQEPLPIESHLDHSLAEHLNAEVVTKTVESKQVCIYYYSIIVTLTQPLCSTSSCMNTYILSSNIAS
jgi:hypothetical protein